MSSDSIQINVNIPVGKLSRRGKEALKAIKPKMKQRIVKDCNLNAPQKNAKLKESALRWAKLLDDYIKWDTPYAHFQHTGKVMIGKDTHSPFARKDETKIYTNRNLTYRQGGSHWVTKTFAQRAQSWGKLGRYLFKKEFNK